MWWPPRGDLLPLLLPAAPVWMRELPTSSGRPSAGRSPQRRPQQGARRAASCDALTGAALPLRGIWAKVIPSCTHRASSVSDGVPGRGSPTTSCSSVPGARPGAVHARLRQSRFTATRLYVLPVSCGWECPKIRARCPDPLSHPHDAAGQVPWLSSSRRSYVAEIPMFAGQSLDGPTFGLSSRSCLEGLAWPIGDTPISALQCRDWCVADWPCETLKTAPAAESERRPVKGLTCEHWDLSHIATSR